MLRYAAIFAAFSIFSPYILLLSRYYHAIISAATLRRRFRRYAADADNIADV